jgi:YbgC/YbaW family acyl-CoA thioester hydrolase
MPLVHTRSFRVRYYECDAHSHLNNANYLRYMQETAFDASTAAGYDIARYDRMQRYWLIRASGIEFLRPLVYNDRVAVTTWIADFRRVTSRRAYEFRLVEGGNMIARAYTDWVFLDTHSNHPASIPAELVQDFFPEGAPESFPSRPPFPRIPPAPPGAYKMLHTVAWNDLDSMQHVNNAVYLNYITECGMRSLAEFGWPWERMNTQGIAVHLRNLHIQYLLPALIDEELEITTWISDIRPATVRRHYTICRSSDSSLLAQASTRSVWIDPSNRKPVRIPRQLLTDLAPLIADS